MYKYLPLLHSCTLGLYNNAFIKPSLQCLSYTFQIFIYTYIQTLVLPSNGSSSSKQNSISGCLAKVNDISVFVIPEKLFLSYTNWPCWLSFKQNKMMFSFMKSLKYQRGNQNPYFEEEQTTQWPKEKVQKDKQWSTKHTYKTSYDYNLTIMKSPKLATDNWFKR